MRLRSLLSSLRPDRCTGEKRDYQDNPWQEKQNDFMRTCFERHKAEVKGVLHVGGHLGEEYQLYRDAGAQRIVFFEPVPDFFEELRKRLGGHRDVMIVQKALGSKNEKREMYIGRGSGESSSFLRPTELYDGFFEQNTFPLEIVTMDSILPTLEASHTFNMIVTDTQGFDLEVLMGARSTLGQIDYIYTEVSMGHYHGEPSLENLDAFLIPLGFRRAETSMYGSWKGKDQWGDIFYVKE